MKTPDPFPWKEAMKFGFGVLKLSSAEFWSMTIRELEAAMRAHYGEVPSVINREWLESAMRKNPDKTNGR